MKRNIIVVTMALGGAGAERVLSELINAWNKDGVDVILIQTDPSYYNDRYRVDPKTKVINIKVQTTNRFLSRLEKIRKIRNILKENPDSPALAFTNPAILLLSLASIGMNNHIVFSERCDPNMSPPEWYRRLVRDFLYNFADRCVFQTEDAKRHFSKKIQDKGTIILNPCNPELPMPFTGKRQKTVVAACQLLEQKNIPMMISAFSRFHDIYDDFKLEIYGIGPDEDKIKKMIDEQQLNNCVFLMGFSKEIHSIMNRCSIYISSSNYEGISNSMLEALALGIPSVVTDCPIGGARMVIENGVNGFLVPVSDDRAMAEAMIKIAGKPEIARRISTNAIKIRDKLPVEKISKLWLKEMGFSESIG